MTAHARIQLRATPSSAPAPRTLREVPPLAPVTTPRARVVALYGTGLVAGFLLAGVASTPGGGAIVAIQLLCAAIAAVAATAGWLVVLRGNRASEPRNTSTEESRAGARSDTVATWPITDLTERRRSSERSM
jgi:hypothetical protein